MSDDKTNEWVGRVRGSYNVPPKTPREAMWREIAGRLGDGNASVDDVEVVELAKVRQRRSRRPAMWATAAAALVVLGIGIGRTTAPAIDAVPDAAAVPARAVALELAAAEHLGRTESLLTMVRADARSGALDPATAGWARELLSETRLLLDVRQDADPTVGELLEDLELVLIQIVGVAEMGSTEDPRVRAELDLALRGLEDGEVLPRIQAALPTSMAGA